MISCVPAMNYMFKVSNWTTGLRFEICSRLRKKTLERCKWRHSSVFIVDCERNSSFALIVEFEPAKVYWVHIEKTNTSEENFEYIMPYGAVFSVWTKVINKWHLNLYHHKLTGQWVRNFCDGGYFRCWFRLKRCGSHSKWPAGQHKFPFLQILLAGRLIRSYLTQLILSCCQLPLSC